MIHPISPPPELSSQDQQPTSRRLKACENCRQRKIKCPGPAEDPNDKTCINCHKSGRTCIFRPKTIVKRRKRVESRMRDLEQKILDLTTHLQHARTNAPTVASVPQNQFSIDDIAFGAEEVDLDESIDNWFTTDGSQYTAGELEQSSPFTFASTSTPPDQRREPALNISFEQLFLGIHMLGPSIGVDIIPMDQGVARLLVHWEKEAVKSFNPLHLRTAFEQWTAQLLSKAPFLLHAICAFSALHLRMLHHNEANAVYQTIDQLFDHHFQLGLTLYSSELSKPVDPESMDALFATCMLFALMAYESSNRDTGGLAWLTSQTGFGVLKNSPTLQPYLSQSVWHQLLEESKYHASELRKPLDTKMISADWLTLCHISEGHSNDNNPYTSALKYLAHIRDIDPEKPENFSYFICFPGHMTPQFKELITSKDRTALLLLSHWLERMYRTGHWWCRNRVQIECEDIVERLGAWSRSNAAVRRLLEAPRRICRSH